jgi:2-polyprenyl-3-methyl-5-hydroxy-6-metoxy-1,4-benzoquinol methylase
MCPDWIDAENKETPWIDPISMAYHMKQWSEPKDSTKAFSNFIADELSHSKSVVDIGAGAGAATYYLARRNLNTNFIGLDYSEELIESAKANSKESGLGNLSFETGDWFDLQNNLGKIDGVISLQTLSWLPEMRTPMVQIFEVIKPDWIGLTSLFYEGEISCRVEVFEHKRDRKTFYNIYSVKELARLAAEYHYEIVKFDRFNIEIDIPRPENVDSMGTFTEKVEGSPYYQRLQISGPLLMNWYFVLLKKISEA